ncbi:hypothetical protein MMC08_001540 [Hypocenomyce scalaris]|nr:hypothetical protein [Hypocenomyce scalaris]
MDALTNPPAAQTAPTSPATPSIPPPEDYSAVDITRALSAGNMARDRRSKRTSSAVEQEAVAQRAITSMLYDPTASRAVAALPRVRPSTPPLYLSTETAQTRVDLPKKDDERSKKGKGVFSKLLKNDDDGVKEPKQYEAGEFFETIRKNRISLPAEPSVGSTVVPSVPENPLHNQWIPYFEKNIVGGATSVPDIKKHMEEFEGEIGRHMLLIHTQFDRIKKYSVLDRDGDTVIPVFRILDLPGNCLREIFSYVLVKRKVLPYRYFEDEKLKDMMLSTGKLQKPQMGVLMAFCSKKPKIARVAEEVRNVLYGWNKYIFREPKDFIFFMSTIGSENVARMTMEKNVELVQGFFERGELNEEYWLAISGRKLIKTMFGGRTWEGGWEIPAEQDAPSRRSRVSIHVKKHHIKANRVWEEGKAMVSDEDDASEAATDIFAWSELPYSLTVGGRPYEHVDEGAHVTEEGQVYHVCREDKHREEGTYEDEEGCRYHVVWWEAKGFMYRWYEEEMLHVEGAEEEANGGEAAPADGSVPGRSITSSPSVYSQDSNWLLTEAAEAGLAASVSSGESSSVAGWTSELEDEIMALMEETRLPSEL